MMEGMKMATEGMMAMQDMQSVIANNLANTGTAGYRRETMDVQSFNAVFDTQMKRAGEITLPGVQQTGFLQPCGGLDIKGMLLTSSRTSHSQGALKMTGNMFDVALDDNGKGFFTVQSLDGIRFTRNGAFRLSTDGYLVTQDGAKVLGQNGPIKLEGKTFKVTDNGKIMVDDKEVDKFLVTEFPDKAALKKQGENAFTAADGFKICEDYQMKQGFIEMSNVNAVQEMVSMIQIMKAFEANSKVLQAQDAALKKTVSEVGKPQ